MDGLEGLPAVPILRIPAQELPLSISYEGPTFGGGGTSPGLLLATRPARSSDASRSRGTVGRRHVSKHLGDRGRARRRRESFQFEVNQTPVAPWNAVTGGRLEAGKHLDFLVEGGIGTRSSILVGAGFRS